jgi:hypothetical protein
MKKTLVVLMLALVSLSVSSQAATKKKDTVWKEVPTKQTAIGFSSQFSNVGLNSFAIRHWLTSEGAIEGNLGFVFADNLKVIDIGGKYIMVIRNEANLKFYGFGALGIENQDINSVSNTGVIIGGGIGWEFFLAGLENLSFNIECGVAYNSMPGVKAFGTGGWWLNSVGVRYYL